MTLRALSIGGLLVVSAVLLGQSDPVPTSAPAEPAMISDLVVQLVHVGGKVDTFKDEVDRLELILGPTGQLDQVHLITRSGFEADTHVWYNMSNLVSVRYQFLAITGKGKVSVRTVQPPTIPPQADTPRRAVPPIEPEDYR